MPNRSRALIAGLSLAFALGTTAAPVAVRADTAEADAAAGTGTVAVDGVSVDASVSDGTDGTTAAPDGDTAQPAVPTEVDRAETYQDSFGGAVATAVSPLAAGRAALEPVSDEMKYFTLFESGKNYDQGFSYGDGYNALGYYQFDRRYSLVSFLRFCVGYDPVTFSLFEPVLARADELSNSSVSMYDAATGQLTDIGRLADSAWHAAYAANPTLFAALQDEYAISNYYRPTERWLASRGISMEVRADCVKGLVWSLTNLFGTGGVQYILAPANLTNDMTDREMVNAIVDVFPQALMDYLPTTPYYASYVDRYERERATCLAYIEEDEAAAGNVSDDVTEGDVSEPGNTADPGVDGTPGETADDADGTDSSADDSPFNEGSTADSAQGGASNDGGSNGGADSDANGAQQNGSASNDASGNQGSSNDHQSGSNDSAASDDPSTGGNSAGGTVKPSKPNLAPQRPSNDSSSSTSDNASGNNGASDNDASNGTTSNDSPSGNNSSDNTSDKDNPSSSDNNAGDNSSSDNKTGDESNDNSSGKGDDNGTDNASDGGSDKGDNTDDGKSEEKDSEKKKTEDDSDNGKDNNTGDPKNTNTGDDGNGGGDNGNQDPAETSLAGMPDTGDLVVMGILASGSLASFGATALYVGARGKKTQQAAEQDSQDAPSDTDE